MSTRTPSRTIDVRMQDVEGVVVDMEKDDDSPMDIDATASELAFHRVLGTLGRESCKLFPDGYCGVA